MALADALARLDAALDRTLELTGRAPAPMGPFTAAFHTPAGMLLRDAEPGEREMFNYVGPRAAPSSTHAAPSVPDQPFFEFNPLQPATPLRPRPATAPPVEPEVLLEAALKLMDGFQPMPRKRKLASAQLAKIETLRESIAQLEQDLATRRVQSAVPEEVAEDAEDDEPSIQELLAQEEAEVKALERKIMLAKKTRAAPPPNLMSPMRVQMAAPPTPKSARRPIAVPSPRPSLPAPSLFKMPPPSAAQTSAWQTPTITRFLNNSQKGRAPSTLTRPSALSFAPITAQAPAGEKETEGEADMSVSLESSSQHADENLLDDTIIDDPDVSRREGDDDTVMLELPPRSPPRQIQEPEEQTTPPAKERAPALVEPALDPIPAVEIDEPEPEPAPTAREQKPLTEAQEAILTKLWTPFGDILRQSPLAPSEEQTLAPQETYDAIQALSELPPPAAPTSITSTTSSSTPAHPVTAQGILLAHVFLRLLQADAHSLPMSAMKAALAQVPGGEEGGVKCIYYAVGKRGLAIKRGGGEARVEFA